MPCWRVILCALPVIFLLTAVGCRTTSTSTSTERSKDAELYYQMGVSYLNEGQIQAAYVQLQKAYQIEPRNKDILNSIAEPDLSDRAYVSLDDFAQLEAAKSDPDGFIRQNNPITVDEAQKCPEIFGAIKRAVDEKRTPGSVSTFGFRQFFHFEKHHRKSGRPGRPSGHASLQPQGN